MKKLDLEENVIKIIFIIFVTYVHLKERNTLIQVIKSIYKHQEENCYKIGFQRINLISIRQQQTNRILNTKDIDGAVPGSLQSQAVRNQEIAKKLRLEREIQNKSCNTCKADELTKKEENYQSNNRQRSNSIQIGYLNVNTKNQLSEQMNSLKLPPISERISDTIDHVANKLQLRQNRKSFQIDGLDFQKKLIQLKLYD